MKKILRGAAADVEKKIQLDNFLQKSMDDLYQSDIESSQDNPVDYSVSNRFNPCEKLDISRVTIWNDVPGHDKIEEVKTELMNKYNPRYLKISASIDQN